MKDTLERNAWRLVAPEFKKHHNLCKRLKFKAGSFIVRDGVLVTTALKRYTAVPLALIESGKVAILMNGRAVKHYGKGECFGLFETATALSSGISERIGSWDVVAATDVTLEISSNSFLKHLSDQAVQALVAAAKDNPIAKPLSRLPLLDWFAATFKLTPQKDVAIAYHSHILPSSQEFIKHLAYIAGPEHTFVLEKPYSTIPAAFRKVTEGGVHTYQLQVDRGMSYEYSIRRGIDNFCHELAEHIAANNIRKLIVVSDGADILLSPRLRELDGVEVRGVEQTQRGLTRLLARPDLPYPVISIADTYAKKHYESPFIAQAALDKLQSSGFIDPSLTYGVLGAGSIGSEIIRGLNRQGITPLVYDPADGATPAARQALSLERLVQKSDIIIGTTGNDCLRGMHIERLKGRKTFVSASSSNIEFAYIFDLAKAYANAFEDVSLQISAACSAVVLNGGYPINFDRTREWEASADIQLTRALLYGAVYEALMPTDHTPAVHSLAPDLERAITRQWLKLKKTKA